MPLEDAGLGVRAPLQFVLQDSFSKSLLMGKNSKFNNLMLNFTTQQLAEPQVQGPGPSTTTWETDFASNYCKPPLAGLASLPKFLLGVKDAAAT